MSTCVAARHILVCDDQDDILEMVSHVLNNVGYVVSRAHDYKEFMQRFHEQKPDLIVLDIYLPEHDGSLDCRAPTLQPTHPYHFHNCP
jgi:CheY-like chemotaxis protein